MINLSLPLKYPAAFRYRKFCTKGIHKIKAVHRCSHFNCSLVPVIRVLFSLSYLCTNLFKSYLLSKVVYNHHISKPLAEKCFVIVPNPTVQMPDLSRTLAWLSIWNARGPLRGGHALFEWTISDHGKKEPSERPELAHQRRSGDVELPKETGELFCSGNKAKRTDRV